MSAFDHKSNERKICSLVSIPSVMSKFCIHDYTAHGQKYKKVQRLIIMINTHFSFPLLRAESTGTYRCMHDSRNNVRKGKITNNFFSFVLSAIEAIKKKACF
jgi:hypothetical protein